MRLLLAAAVLSAATAVHAQLCPTAQLQEWNDIAPICCESSTSTRDCSAGFPATCSFECATMIESYWSACGKMVEALGNSPGIYPADEVALSAFAEGPCVQTRILAQHAALSCDEASLQAEVNDVNAACCEQSGSFVCTDGTPIVCDAECAMEFIPCVADHRAPDTHSRALTLADSPGAHVVSYRFWESCMSSLWDLSTSPRLESFSALYETCRALPPEESRILMQAVHDFDMNPDCMINVTQIISVDEANAPCSQDETDQCTTTIVSGLVTCEQDYCDSCTQAHSCDHSCGFSCTIDVARSSPCFAFLA